MSYKKLPAISRFSQIYLSRGKATTDSVRFRNRLRAFYSKNLHRDFNSEIVNAYEEETGATVTWYGMGPAFSEVFTSAELRDLLDAISVVFNVLQNNRLTALAKSWFDFVNRALREENLEYALESDGVIHYYVDEEFQVSKHCTIKELSRADLSAARTALEDAFRHLNAQNPDTKASLRSIFESAEILAKLIIPDTKNLNRYVVENKITPIFLASLSNDHHQQKVMGGMLTGMAEWVDAIHEYRHGQGVSSPIAPSTENSIHIISLGLSYIRLLVPLTPTPAQQP